MRRIIDEARSSTSSRQATASHMAKLTETAELVACVQPVLSRPLTQFRLPRNEARFSNLRHDGGTQPAEKAGLLKEDQQWAPGMHR